MYIDQSIKQYITDLAAKKPAPGGGSAAALGGALGASLILMALNFTSGKPTYKAYEETVNRAIFDLEKIKDAFSALVDEDVACYNKLKDAFKQKKDKKDLEPFLVEAVEVPLKICNLCYNAMTICSGLAHKVNKNLVTDIGCGALFLNEGFLAARLNVDINLNSMTENAALKLMKKDLSLKEKEMTKIRDRVLKDVKRIMERK